MVWRTRIISHMKIPDYESSLVGYHISTLLEMNVLDFKLRVDLFTALALMQGTGLSLQRYYLNINRSVISEVRRDCWPAHRLLTYPYIPPRLMTPPPPKTVDQCTLSCTQKHGHLWKHYLPTTYVVGNNCTCREAPGTLVYVTSPLRHIVSHVNNVWHFTAATFTEKKTPTTWTQVSLLFIIIVCAGIYLKERYCYCSGVPIWCTHLVFNETMKTLPFNLQQLPDTKDRCY